MKQLFSILFFIVYSLSSYAQCNGPLEIDLVVDYADCSNPNSGIITLLTQDQDSVTYSIDGAPFVNTPQFPNLGPGTYTFTINDTTGCTTTEVGVIPEPLEVDYVNIVTSCNNEGTGEIELDGLNGFPIYQYSFNGGLTYDIVNTIDELDAGVYHVVIKDNYDCEVDTMITINSYPTISPTITTANEQCNGSGPGEVDVSFTNGANYDFSLDGGALSSGLSYNNTSLFSGFYVLSITDENNCTSPFQFEIGADQVDDSVNTTNELCRYGNGEVEVFGFLGVAPYEYSIDNGVTYQSSGVFTGLTQNTYVVFAKDATGCIKKDSIYVANFGGVDAVSSVDDTVCLGNNTIISVSHNVGLNASFQWSNGLGVSQTHTVSPSSTTTYNVVVTDNYGCKDTVETTIFVENFPVVSLNETQVQSCIGDEIELTVFGADRYEWSTGSTTDMINYTAIGNETITVTGFNGQCSDQEQAVIIIKPSPTAFASANATSINTGETIAFSNSGSITSTTSWDFGDGFSSMMSHPTHEFEFPGAYMVVLTSEMGGCEASDSILVYVGTVAINENLESTTLVYPNPAKDFLNIDVKSNCEFTLTSVNGKIVLQKELNSNLNQISLINFPKGIYIGLIKGKENHYQFKLVVS